VSAPLDDGDETLGCLGLIAVLPFTTAIYVAVSGFVGAQLWRWFVVPTFHVAPLPLGAAVGLALLVRWATYRSSGEKDKRSNADILRSVPKEIVSSLVIASYTLLVGYIVQRWFL
jgi:hypothetical protein